MMNPSKEKMSIDTFIQLGKMVPITKSAIRLAFKNNTELRTPQNWDNELLKRKFYSRRQVKPKEKPNTKVDN